MEKYKKKETTDFKIRKWLVFTKNNERLKSDSELKVNIRQKNEKISCISNSASALIDTLSLETPKVEINNFQSQFQTPVI